MGPPGPILQASSLGLWLRLGLLFQRLVQRLQLLLQGLGFALCPRALQLQFAQLAVNFLGFVLRRLGRLFGVRQGLLLALGNGFGLVRSARRLLQLRSQLGVFLAQGLQLLLQ
ncbi:hypothetical protein D3C84_1093170 [compost metagenome]